MVRVTAATSFLGNEGMWRPGDTKRVSNDRAHELLTLGHVIEAGDQEGEDENGPHHTLQAVADAIGATVAPVVELPEVPGIPAKEDKHKRKTKEDKAATERETKEEK